MNNYQFKTRTYSGSLIARMYYNIKTRQPDTDITKEWLAKKVKHGYCELTGIKFDKRTSGRRKAKQPSVDRVDNNKGYFKDNCRVILCWLNIAKSDMEEDYFIERLRELKPVCRLAAIPLALEARFRRFESSHTDQILT